MLAFNANRWIDRVQTSWCLADALNCLDEQKSGCIHPQKQTKYRD